MVWWFLVPKVVFGEDALDELEQIEGKKAFIVTDKVIAEIGLAEKVQTKLQALNWDVRIWNNAEADPKVSTAKSAAKEMRSFGADWIFAIGGGSVMDAAKAAWVLYANPDMNLEALTPFDSIGVREKAKLVCIPTTAGTGSETTKAIVVREDESGRKFATINSELVADLAILEPEFVKGLPRDLTAYTGMDALTHAVEAYVSMWKNDFSDACARQAIRMVFQWLPKSVDNLEDLEAREKMLVAANLAGMAFSNSQVCLAHSLGHSMGSVLRTQHGLAVGLALPYTIEYSAHDNPETATHYSDLAGMLGIVEKSEEGTARLFAESIRNLQKSIGFPTSIKEAGVTEEEFEKALDKMVEFAMMDSSITMTPRNIGSGEIRRMYEYMFDGKRIDF
ncbi:iron-containing alcohol dehydrogenase [Candidatus Thorarchaeota archaeon]|nr:MAG: iron-containing alcohol dehydrogenase [Candidatus Thorarchaeota archaeon]